MLSFSRNGITFRTRLLPLPQAERFARCIAAHPAFSGAIVNESPNATHPERRWFVAYQPARGARLVELVAQVQSIQTQRADEQVNGYAFIRDDSGKCFHALNLKSGALYAVTEDTCSCPHFEVRCFASGIQCKHIVLLGRALAAGEIHELPEPQPAHYEDPFGSDDDGGHEELPQMTERTYRSPEMERRMTADFGPEWSL